MGGQGDELSEALPHKVPAEVIHLVCAIVDVSNHNSVLARVNKIPQMVGRSEQGFLFGTVNCNYIEVPELIIWKWGSPNLLILLISNFLLMNTANPFPRPTLTKCPLNPSIW